MMNHKSFLLLTTLMLLMAGRALGDPAMDYYNSGVDKNAKGDLDGALADFTKVIALKPDYADAYNNRGIIRAKGGLDGALADFTKAIELQPDNASGYYNRGIIRAKGDPDGALADFTKTIELNPDVASAYYNRGHVKQVNGGLDGALTDYTKAIALQPDHASAYNNRGSVKQAKGDLDGALADYTKAIQLEPRVASRYHNRGCFHYDKHEFTDALVDFGKAIKLDASLDYSHIRLWLVRARLGEVEPATKELRSYLETRKTGRPDDWESSILRFLTGQLAEPAFFKAAANQDKKKETGQQCEASFYAGTKRLIEGDKATAADYFQKCLATDQKIFAEHQSAAAELKFLKSTK
ncbi:MAG: repeat-containing serine protease [Pedosphaera sp.]|nr:repeat-containing serine protease [Pedosphaera sp.]